METTWIVGPNPLDQETQAASHTRPATLFLGRGMLVTEGATHFGQCLRFREWIDEARTRKGEGKISDDDWRMVEQRAVCLYYAQGCLEISVGRNDLDQVFEADEFLQARHVPKPRIRFQSVNNPKFLDRIRRRGELWRVTPWPRGAEEIARHLEASRTSLGQQPIYYYNRFTGTRFLTYAKFRELEGLDDDSLAAQMLEIAEYLPKWNRCGEREIRFWPREPRNAKAILASIGSAPADPKKLRAGYGQLLAAFEEATPPGLRRDDPEVEEWRNRLFDALTEDPDEHLSQQQPDGLGPEYRRSVAWLPGCRFVDHECELDKIFEEKKDPEAMKLCDPLVRELILNQTREFADIEYLNLGRIPQPLGQNPQKEGRRDVFLMEIKRASRPRPDLRVIRFLKWGMREHLLKGKEWARAYGEALEYIEYSTNRRLGCRQLGLNLPRRLSLHLVGETLVAPGRKDNGAHIWAFYFERAYIEGVPTHRLSRERLKDHRYALAVAGLLGAAAAVNLILARGDEHTKQVVFDVGDEIIRHDLSGMPVELVTCDHSGAFALYDCSLEALAPAYAAPVQKRLDALPNRLDFAERYVETFQAKFSAIKNDYKEHQEQFDRLFANLHRDPHGSMATRWDQVLEHLDHAEPAQLARRLKEAIGL